MKNMIFQLHFSQEGQSEEEARACPACAKRGRQGRLGAKFARRSGGFIGCSCYPDCSYSQPLDNITKSIKSDQESDDELFPGLSEGVCRALAASNNNWAGTACTLLHSVVQFDMHVLLDVRNLLPPTDM